MDESNFTITISFGVLKTDEGPVELMGKAAYTGEYHEILKEVAIRYELFRCLLQTKEETKEYHTALVINVEGSTKEELTKISDDLNWWVEHTSPEE